MRQHNIWTIYEASVRAIRSLMLFLPHIFFGYLFDFLAERPHRAEISFNVCRRLQPARVNLSCFSSLKKQCSWTPLRQSSHLKMTENKGIPQSTSFPFCSGRGMHIEAWADRASLTPRWAGCVTSLTKAKLVWWHSSLTQVFGNKDEVYTVVK